jgi:hypothetical protein
MFGQSDFVVVQREEVAIADPKPKWTQAFAVSSRRAPREGVLVLNVRHLTHKPVPVRINGHEAGHLEPHGPWQALQEHWFTQYIAIDGGILRSGKNVIQIEAMELNGRSDNRYDDLDLRDVVCFYH